MLTLKYDPSYGSRYDYLWMPPYKYSWEYNKYDSKNPLSRFEPSRHCYWYPHYWPAHLMNNTPTASSLREVRMLQIKYYPGEGYNLQYMPDYRFYCDEKILRPLSSYYDYPFRTRVWVPYGKWRVYYDQLPFRTPFREQRIRRVLYNIPQTLEPCYPYNL